MGRVIAVFLLLISAEPARQLEAPWREAPEFGRLFGAVGPHSSAYRTYISDFDLNAVLQQLSGNPSLVRPPGSWLPQALLPLDAFGQTGAYDRWAVRRLYGARRATVARGPRAEDGRIVESWTLISPYPDTALQRLEPGTLLIVLRLE